MYASLYQWYQQHGRKDLPWRISPTPYQVWVSEVMLQQTQVNTIKNRFYKPFLSLFPNIKALANSDEQTVMKAWEGLGYYRRARFLHKAAKDIGEGELPDSVSQLLSLPGIGKNTAHAILAFGFYQPYPVMEANLRRVLCRYYGLKEPSDALLWEKAYQLLDVYNPFDYNQAMMDIGALVCTKQHPSCDMCPLHKACKGKEGPQEYMVKKIKKKPPLRYRIIRIRQTPAGSVFLYPRQTAFLGGLWGFEQFEDVDVSGDYYLGDVKQVYSHFTLHAKVYVSIDDCSADSNGFYKLDEVDHMPISKLDQKVLALFRQHNT